VGGSDLDSSGVADGDDLGSTHMAVEGRDVEGAGRDLQGRDSSHPMVPTHPQDAASGSFLPIHDLPSQLGGNFSSPPSPRSAPRS
jgi:hypothetical protein